MKPRGEDTEQAVRDWIRSEIITNPGVVRDLGKFFFSVSSSTVGLLVTLEKFGTTPRIDWQLGLSIFALFWSMVIALRMAIPNTVNLTGDTNLFTVYEQQIRRVSLLSGWWFCIWILSVIIGLGSVL